MKLPTPQNYAHRLKVQKRVDLPAHPGLEGALASEGGFTDWQAMASSNIAQARYNASLSLLEIAFRNGGVYQYSHVPAQVWAVLLNAPSKGRYVHAHIRGKFAARRLGALGT